MTQLICGCLHLDGSVPDRAEIQALARAMVADGLPHSISCAVSGPMAIAAVSLGLRGGADPTEPPALIADGDRMIAVDAALHDGVIRDGRIEPPVARLEALLAKQGLAGLGTVNGDFALARWDHGRLTLARDQFGMRPLTYTHVPGRYLAFASMPNALLQTGLASPELDPGLVAGWLLQPATPVGRSLYRDIQSVIPAHGLVVASGSVEQTRYWRLDIRTRLPFDSDPAELAAETRRLLEQAVIRRLPQQGPGGGALSGGLDSSPIAVLAARVLRGLGQPFYGYTMTEDDLGDGDTPFAALVAEAEPAITQIPVTSPGYWHIWEQGIEPGTLLPQSSDDPDDCTLRHAAGQRVGCLFSGWGGDQIVSYQGRGAEFELARAGRFLRLREALVAEGRATGVSAARVFLSNVMMRAIPQRPREALRLLAGRDVPFQTTIALNRKLVTRHRRRGLLVETWPDTGGSHRIRRDSAEGWNPTARMDGLAWHGARHGVAHTYPLLDLDLVNFSMQIPGIFLRYGGERRRLFRQALTGLIPDAVRDNALKTSPFPHEARRAAAMRAPLLAILARWRENARVRDFLDLEHMEKIVQAAGDPAPEPASLGECDLTAAFQIGTLLEQHGQIGGSADR